MPRDTVQNILLKAKQGYLGFAVVREGLADNGKLDDDEKAALQQVIASPSPDITAEVRGEIARLLAMDDAVRDFALQRLDLRRGSSDGLTLDDAVELQQTTGANDGLANVSGGARPSAVATVQQLLVSERMTPAARAVIGPIAEGRPLPKDAVAFLARLAKGDVKLSEAQPPWTFDRRFQLAALAIQPAWWPDVPPALRSDPAFQTSVATLSADAFGAVMRENPSRDVVLAAVRANGGALRYAGPFTGDRDVCNAAIRSPSPGDAMSWVSPALLADRDFVLAAAKIGAHMLLVAPELRDDKEIMMASLAATEDANALLFAGPHVQRDPDFIRAAIAQSPGAAYDRLDDADKANPKWALLALRTAGPSGYFPTLHPAVLANRAFMAEAVKVQPRMLRFASPALKNDREIVWSAIEGNPQALGFAGDDVRKDRYFAAKCIARCGATFAFLDDSLRADVDLCRKALADCPSAYQYATGKALTDRALFLDALKASAFNLQFTRVPYANDPELVEQFLLRGGWVDAQQYSVHFYRSDFSDDVWAKDAALDPHAFAHLPDQLKNDPAFVARAAALNPLVVFRVDAAMAARLPKELVQKAEQLRDELKALDIDCPERIPPPLLREMIDNRTKPRSPGDHRPLALYVVSKEDHNGAFGVTNLVDTMKSCRVIYREARTDEDLARILDDLPEKAALLSIGGHGTRDFLALGAADPAFGVSFDHEEQYVDAGDAAKLRGPLSKAVADGGHVVLRSCSTGEGRGTQKNLAQLIHGLVPKAFVHAPTAPTNGDVRVDTNGKFLDAGFRDGSAGTYDIAPD